VVVVKQPGDDQAFGGHVFRGVGERITGAVLPRTGERAVQHRGGSELAWVSRRL
jgi:hypothetical protein